MCGICGAVHLTGKPVSPELLQAMNSRLQHRGPDGDGYHIAGQLGLAMRRLRIIDLAGSDQPLYNEDQSIAVVFNGEIYNYQDLRHSLIQRGHRFRTQGDGETIAHLYEEYGADCCQHLRGMFAFALWDQRERRLLLARDRMGQKPLYYYHDDRVFVFASEIKAILAHPDVPRVSNFCASPNSLLGTYLSFGYVPARQTAFQDIFMLEPAKTLQLDVSGRAEIQTYWDIEQQAPLAAADPQARPAAYVASLREQLEEAVKLRLMSDVPLGALLSGGIDSSLITALMRRHSNATVKTFNIGFNDDDSFDETPYALQVADFLETEHRTLHLKPDAIALLSALVWHHDQPFADSSAIPTYLVSRLAREQVTVVLTGDGGDELFAGYERFEGAWLLQQLSFIPPPFWHGLEKLIDRLPESTDYDSWVKRARRFVPAARKPIGAAYFDMVRMFDADLARDISLHPGQVPRDLSSYISGAPDDAVIGTVEANMRSYLPDDLLIKMDRCSMQASLEARSPFLDHKLVEYAASIPFNLKLKGRRKKFILKEMARGLLPNNIIHRRKHGFGIPLGAWLRQDIAPVRDILLSRQARQRGLFNMAMVEDLINQHVSRKHDRSYQLWTLLTLEEWHRQWFDAPSPSEPDEVFAFIGEKTKST